MRVRLRTACLAHALCLFVCLLACDRTPGSLLALQEVCRYEILDVSNIQKEMEAFNRVLELLTSKHSARQAAAIVPDLVRVVPAQSALRVTREFRESLLKAIPLLDKMLTRDKDRPIAMVALGTRVPERLGAPHMHHSFLTSGKLSTLDIGAVMKEPIANLFSILHKTLQSKKAKDVRVTVITAST